MDRMDDLFANAGDKRWEKAEITMTRGRRVKANNAATARRWAVRLSRRVKEIMAEHPGADPDNIRLTLILLEQPPLERLQKSLIRGRAAAILRK